MAVPRPVLLLSVLGAALLAVTFYTVRGAREQSQNGEISKAVQIAQPQPVKRLKPQGKAPAHAKHKSAPAIHKAAPAHPKGPPGHARPRQAGQASPGRPGKAQGRRGAARSPRRRGTGD